MLFSFTQQYIFLVNLCNCLVHFLITEKLRCGFQGWKTQFLKFFTLFNMFKNGKENSVKACSDLIKYLYQVACAQ